MKMEIFVGWDGVGMRMGDIPTKMIMAGPGRRSENWRVGLERNGVTGKPSTPSLLGPSPPPPAGDPAL